MATIGRRGAPAVLLLLVLAVLAGAGACGSRTADTAASPQPVAADGTTTTVATLSLRDAWAEPSAVGATKAPVFLTVTSPVEDRVVAAAVPAAVAAAAELHETVEHDMARWGTRPGDRPARW